MGRHRAPACREFAEGRDVEISKHGHGDRSRNRSRRHDDDVRSKVTSRLRGESSTLLDTESVLLIDDDEPKIAKLDGVLNERMSSNYDPSIP